MPQTGKRTSSDVLPFFGSEIARLTGELLADTTQTAPYIRITWEPRLRTLTSSETYLQFQIAVESTNSSTSGEMSAWIVPQQHGIKKEFGLSIWTVLFLVSAISMVFKLQYPSKTTLDYMLQSIRNSVVLQAQLQRPSSGLEGLSNFLITDQSMKDPVMGWIHCFTCQPKSLLHLTHS